MTIYIAFTAPSAKVLEEKGVCCKNKNQALEERSKLKQQRKQFTTLRYLEPKGEFKAVL